MLGILLNHSRVSLSSLDGSSNTLLLQAQLQMFRAQWMFELTPGVGSSNLETRPCRAGRGSILKAAADSKGRQELAKEEKVSAKVI